MSSKAMRWLWRKFGRMHFIRFGIRDRLLRLYDSPNAGRKEAFETPFYGFKYTGNFDTFIDWSVYYYGAYSIQELNFIRDIASFQNLAFVDIGANLGQHSLFASKYFERVLSIEPYEKVYTKLIDKVSTNGIENIALVSCGLGEADEILSFYPPQTQNTGTGSFAAAKHMDQAIELKVRRGDDVMLENNIPREAVIKIDTEGFEPIVLRGLSNFIETHQPILFFEWSQNEMGTNEQNPKSTMLPSAYVCYQFLDHLPCAIFFERKAYRLQKLVGPWQDGMILAFHQDKLHDKGFREFIMNKEQNSIL